MSVVVAVKDRINGVVYMGADSQVSYNYTKETLTNENNYKIVRPKDEPNTLIGIVGMIKMINALRCENRVTDELTEMKNEVNFKYVFNNICPKIYNMSIKNDCYEVSNDIKYMDSHFLYSHKNRVFSIGSNADLIEIDDYTAIGSGVDFAMGYLNSVEFDEDTDYIEVVRKAVESACKSALHVSKPIIVTSTKSEGFDIFE